MIAVTLPPIILARAIYAAVQGAQLIAHTRGDVSVYEGVIATYRANGLIP